VDKVIGRYKIPARTPIVIDVRRLNTNALTWGHDGNEFRPERFAKLSPNDYRYGYVRFRVMACKASECLGRYMVDVLMKVAVITILETYSIQSVENQYTVESRQLAFVNRK
jgi:cytochrome P450 monooxygenase